MQKKLTITIDEVVYEGLYKFVGRRRISQFIEDLVRPHVLNRNLEAAIKKWPKTGSVGPKRWNGRKH